MKQVATPFSVLRSVCDTRSSLARTRGGQKEQQTQFQNSLLRSHAEGPDELVAQYSALAARPEDRPDGWGPAFPMSCWQVPGSCVLGNEALVVNAGLPIGPSRL